MTYSTYATKINTDTSSINNLLTSITSIDLDSSWKGDAATKQITNLEKILTDNNTQLHNLEELSALLLQIDEYDKEKNKAKEYETKINNLNKEDPKYQDNLNNLVSLKDKSISNYETLKKQITEKLSSITTRYNEQYVDLSATTVENTASLFVESEKKLNELDNHLTIKATAKNGDKTSSENAGTIQFDKQGTYYDKEPTPILSAQKLHVYHNGQRLYDDACITIKKGETIRLTVNISDNGGELKLLKRTTASGITDDKNPKNNWTNWFSAHSEPFVNRHDKSTYIKRTSYDWVITGDKVTKDYVTLSQTTFHSTEIADELKSMYRINVRVVE